MDIFKYYENQFFEMFTYASHQHPFLIANLMNSRFFLRAAIRQIIDAMPTKLLLTKYCCRYTK